VARDAQDPLKFFGFALRTPHFHLIVAFAIHLIVAFAIHD
jgi:hypothetical protein